MKVRVCIRPAPLNRIIMIASPSFARRFASATLMQGMFACFNLNVAKASEQPAGMQVRKHKVRLGGRAHNQTTASLPDFTLILLEKVARPNSRNLFRTEDLQTRIQVQRSRHRPQTAHLGVADTVQNGMADAICDSVLNNTPLSSFA